VGKFRELVIEKILMNNIKFVNSLKFAFAKASFELKRSKTAARPKSPWIQFDINVVNDWLLEISHFMLDTYQQLIGDNLAQVRQPPLSEVLNMARKEIHFLPLYETVPEFIFKDFEFCYIKSLSRKRGVAAEHYEEFSSMVYIFHRVLIDSLNTALMEELATGREWIRTPWQADSKFRAPRSNPEHAKLCLERAINVVSNWAEYGLGRLDY
jgi:hypothetical protein